MFTIDLRSSNVSVSLALHEHIVRRLDFSVRRFAHRIERVVVRLADINGPRGGPDKRCRILAVLDGPETVVVEATDADAYAAVSQATMRLEERVARVLMRRRARPLARRRIGPALPPDDVASDEVDMNEPA